MEISQTSNRIHPLMAGAAVSVMLVSMLGAAAIVGIIPTSQGTVSDKTAAMVPAAQAIVPASAPSAAPALPATALAVAPQPATAPAVAAPVAKAEPKEVIRHKTVVHHKYVEHPAPTRAQPVQVAQTEPQRTYSPAPVYQQAQQPAPAAQNSPIGIGVGAVVGGLIGNQIGGGSGRALATVAGAVGGGYIGNEIAKRNP